MTFASSQQEKVFWSIYSRPKGARRKEVMRDTGVRRLATISGHVCRLKPILQQRGFNIVATGGAQSRYVIRECTAPRACAGEPVNCL